MVARSLLAHRTSSQATWRSSPTKSTSSRPFRYSQAIWKDSSSSWESEMFMGGKRTRTARVPCHRRFATRLRPSTATGSERKITSPNTCVSGVSMTSAIANADPASCARRRRAWTRSAGPRPPYPPRRRRPAGWNGSGRYPCRRQPKQRARLANLDGPFRNDFKFVFLAGHWTAVRSRRMGKNKWRPPAARATVRLRSCRQPSDTPSERP